MSMVGFTWRDAQRISGAVQWSERERGTIHQDISSGALRPQESWVKTPASLPGGYDGSTALQGKIIFRLDDGTDYELDPCWIKDPNGTALEAGKVYRGTFNQILTQSGDAYPLFLVQAGAPSVDDRKLEFVWPWRRYTVHYPTGDGTYWSSSFTAVQWLYVRSSRYFLTNYDLRNLKLPGDPYYVDGYAGSSSDHYDDDTRIFIAYPQREIFPHYSLSSTDLVTGWSGSPSIEASYIAAKRMCPQAGSGWGRPGIFSVFRPASTSNQAYIVGYGGATIPVYTNIWNNDPPQYGDVFWGNMSLQSTARMVRTTVTARVDAGSKRWGTVNSGTFTDTSGATKSLYYHFYDPRNILPSSGSQACMVDLVANNTDGINSGSKYSLGGPFDECDFFWSIGGLV